GGPAVLAEEGLSVDRGLCQGHHRVAFHGSLLLLAAGPLALGGKRRTCTRMIRESGEDPCIGSHRASPCNLPSRFSNSPGSVPPAAFPRRERSRQAVSPAPGLRAAHLPRRAT